MIKERRTGHREILVKPICQNRFAKTDLAEPIKEPL
jgi:hypothetical protein